MNKTPTIDDVAVKAGVSKSTVSRVLNNSPRISKKTKKRVLEAICELQYEPNNIARSLIKKKSYTIGVILEDILNPFFTEVAKGIETTLKKAGYTMLLTSSDYIYEDEIKLTQMLLRNKVDGILITPLKPDSKAIKILKERKIPLFIINCKSEDRDISWIDSDNYDGGYIATKYLINLGHRRFMCIRSIDVLGSKDRFEGFKKALKESNLKLTDQVILGNARSRIDGYKLLSNFIKEKGKKCIPSAIISVNDAVAIGAMEVMFENNVNIPDEVSIIGYDDIYFAGLMRVPLTTIYQPKFKMGEMAASQLIDKIDRDEVGVARQILVKPKLIIRKSCRECFFEK